MELHSDPPRAAVQNNQPIPRGTRSFMHPVIVRGVFIVPLVLLVTAVYHPALDRYFAGDQVIYFAELKGDRSLQAGLRLLDYARAREYAKGDDLLYRPLLFAWLAVQNAWLGRDFRAWNQVNLMLHIVVAYVLFEALWRIRRTLLASGFALLFAVLAANFDLVTWNHLGGYMLGYAALLIAIMAAREGILSGGRQPGPLGFYAASMTVAMMFHEIAVITGVLIAMAWGFRLRRSPTLQRAAGSAAVLAPIVIYGTLYALRGGDMDRLLWFDRTHAGSLRITAFLEIIPVSLSQWTVKTMIPAACHYHVFPFDRYAWKDAWTASAPLASVLLAVALWAGLIWFLRRGFTARHPAATWRVPALIAVMLAAYVAMHYFGRTYILDVSYYVYFFSLMALTALYSLIDFERIPRRSQWGALAAIVLLIAMNAHQTYANSREVRQIHKWPTHYYQAIENQVKDYLHLPGFTFVVSNMPPLLNPEWEVAVGYPDAKQYKEIPMLKMIYGQHYETSHPLYHVDFHTA